ncbi:polysaccharide deacetylase family protein [Nitrosococcus halophilus]|nr:polysaccharide deacetylase family protein [Nitrosococcus halophilus]
MLEPLASLFWPGGRRARLSVLIYHRVLPSSDPLMPGEPDAAQFRWQMELLARYFNPLPLAEAARRLWEGTLPPRAVSVTFDDGYADNVEVALPILQQVGVPATFFIATGYLDGGWMWNDKVIEALRRMPDGELDLTEEGLEVCSLSNTADRLTAVEQILARLKYLSWEEREAQAQVLAQRCRVPLSNSLMMTSSQVRELHQAGMEIGAHTRNHPILASLARVSAEQEIAASKAWLEDLLGESVRLFAYPNGKPGKDYLQEHVDIVRGLGFEAAVSTAWGVASSRSDPWQLPRFTPWDRTPSRFMMRLLWNYRSVGVPLRED